MSYNLAKITALAATATLLLGTNACMVESPAPPESRVVSVEYNGFVVDAQGVIHFDSHEAFFTTITSVARMTPAELDAWEERHGFVSYRREFEHVMHQVMNAPTPQEADAILRANEDIVEVTDDDANPRIRAFGYSAVVDRSGIFYVEGVIHKVTPDVVISAEDGRKETIDTTIASLGKHGTDLVGSVTTPAEGVRIVRYDGGLQEQQLVPYGCTDYKSAFYNASDRKVDLDVWTWDYYCAGCCGNYYHQVIVEGRLRGYKKNWLNNWVSYQTSYDYQNLEFQVNAPEVTGVGIGPTGQLVSIFTYQPYTVSGQSGSSPGDWATWHFGSWSVGHQVQNSPIELPYFNKVKGQGKSRGTGANGWAEICCGYAGGCNFAPICVPKTSCNYGECGYLSNYCGGTIYCGACGGSGGGGECGPSAKSDGSNLIPECP